MPPKLHTTLYDFTAPAVNLKEYALFGGVLPLPQSGMSLLMIALFLLLGIGLFHRRIPARWLKVLMVGGIAVTYLSTYIISARWLDDVFINLIHPFNLFHHHRFSTLMRSMNNGTVEIVYYTLLAPFAGDRLGLIRANYMAGMLIGSGHLLLVAQLLRKINCFPRFVALTVFAFWIPVIQAFSSGYGNGLVTLFWLMAVVALVRNETAKLAFYSFLLPLLRPDALLYSISLAIFYVILRRRFTLLWWLPTLLSLPLYLGMIHLMYHQWLPTPVTFKRVSVSEILSVAPDAFSGLFLNYFLGSPERILLLFLTGAFFVLPTPDSIPFTRRAAGAFLISTLPALCFFYTTGQLGYNPTNYRYYGCFEIALCITGLFGLISLLQTLPAQYQVIEGDPASQDITTTEKATRPTSYFLPVLPAVLLLFTLASISRSIRLEKDTNALYGSDIWEGRDVGIECTYYDLKRIDDLRFAGQYFGKIVPSDWMIASTEMNTFGYFSGHEILDLWGFSNKRIAQSSEKMTSGVRRDSHLFQQSHVPLFWVRTLSNYDPVYRLFHEKLESPDMSVFAQGFWPFPNLSWGMRQAGYLDTTLQKYDIVRIKHGSAEISLLLIRHDLAEQFKDMLVRNGATFIGQHEIELNPRELPKRD